MDVAIIGSGNVATILGRLITKNNHRVVHVASRNIENAEILSKEFMASYSGYDGMNNINPDLFLVAVSDAAITECVSKFQLHDKPVVHTAGSVSKDILKNTSSNYGVLYPLQSLRKEMQRIPEIPFLIDGNSDPAAGYIEGFARSLSNNVHRTNDAQRLRLHLAAVIVSNFTNHLYALGEDFCKNEHVDFNMLKPLIKETAERIDHIAPSQMQTGPAVRKDIHTLDKHLRLLSNYPRLRYIYLKLTDSIMNP